MKALGTRVLDALAALVGLLPEGLVGALAQALGACWWHVLRYRRAVILENLGRAFPEASLAERRALGRRATTHLVRLIFEFLRIPRYRRLGLERFVEFEGLEHAEAARREGKGVLCLSGHLGSFELAVAAVAARVQPISLVVKAFPPAIDAFLTRVRSESGLGLIRAETAGRGVLRALERGEIIVFVLDQNATRSTGVFVEFFGHTASTYSALASLAVRRGVPVIATIPYRTPEGRHRLKILPAIPLEPRATREATVQHMTQVYTRVIEDAIRAHPEQWFWTHRRWRTQPKPGLPADGLRTPTDGVSTPTSEGPDA